MPTGRGGEASDILDRLLAAHEAYFDVERDYELGGVMFDGFAQLHASSSQYVLVKRAKLWETSSHEYLFLKIVDTLGTQVLDELVEFMRTRALDVVELDQNHMNSFLTLVIIANDVQPGLERAIEGTRFRKNFLFGLRGWSDLRVCVIDRAQCRIVTNRMGRELVPTLEANAFIGPA